MSETTTTMIEQPHSPLRPVERHAQLETDTFCIGCGYNLRAQPVVRDERLGIFVCRCPECGKYHPAGTGVTATTVWLSRFASALLVMWVLFVINAVIWISVALGLAQVVMIEATTYRKTVDSSGVEVEWQGSGTRGFSMVRKGTTQPVWNWHMVYSFDPPTSPSNPFTNIVRPWWAVPMVVLINFAIGVGAGVLLIIFLWHWPRKRYRLAMILPLIVAGVVIAIAELNDEFMLVRNWARLVVVGMALIESAGLFTGTFIGRPIARGLLRTFIPPKPRQHFTFLWKVDGKTMSPPAVNV